jgi:hypothetical protein
VDLIEYSATVSDVENIDNIRKLHYPENVLVPLSLYTLIISRQANSSFILCNNENIIGYYSLVFLEKATYELLMKRIISEKELDKVDYIPLITDKQNYNDKYIYVLSIVAKELENTKANLSLFYSLKKTLKRFTSEYKIHGVFTEFFNAKLKNIFRENEIIESIL